MTIPYCHFRPKTPCLSAFFLLLMSFMIGSLRAQEPFEVTPATNVPYTPDNLIKSVFLGDGVQVLNVTFKGNKKSLGYFKGGKKDLNIGRGIIMSTGEATSAAIKNLDGAISGFTSGQSVQDADLLAIIQNGKPYLIDGCLIEIDFIPSFDTIQFRYAFASEEYPEFGCDQFNDVFGFFLSGPDINGTYENNGINIALIPNTNLPVAISNVHPAYGNSPSGPCAAKNLAYYKEVPTGGLPTYDGMTTLLTAKMKVTPCKTYKIKLVIADVGDEKYDSAVFLEAKSFGSKGLKVQASTPSADASLGEACAEGSVFFNIPDPAKADFPIDVKIIGSATNGSDYEKVSDKVVIKAGQKSTSLVFKPLQDNLKESDEEIWVDYQKDNCKRDTIRIKLRDYTMPKPNLGKDIAVCLGDEVWMDGKVSTPTIGSPNFKNSAELNILPTNEVKSSNINILTSPYKWLAPNVIESVCIDITHPNVSDLDVILIAPGGQFIELTTGNGGASNDYKKTCFTPKAAKRINEITGTFPDNSPAPFTDNFLPEGDWEDFWFGKNPVNGTWTLQVIDKIDKNIGKLNSWEINLAAPYTINYKWSPADALSCTECFNPLIKPLKATQYVMTASDTYGCSNKDTINITIADKSTQTKITCGTTTGNSVVFEWDQIAGATKYEVKLGTGAWGLPNGTNLSHKISGLKLDEATTLSVRAFAKCVTQPGEITCKTLPCNAPEATAVTANVKCKNGADGSVAISATGGTGFSFLLDGKTNTTGKFDNLKAGNYTADVSAGGKCNTKVTFEVKEPPISFNIDSTSATRSTCFGSKDGSAKVVVSGGVAPYTYLWSDASKQTTTIATKIAGGTYTVTATDKAGCAITATAEVKQPEGIVITSDVTQPSCGGVADGKAKMNVTGIQGVAKYLWNDPNAQTTIEAVNLKGGIYKVQVTDTSKPDCTASLNVVVPDPPKIESKIATTAPDCNVKNSGTATVSASGGTGGLSYKWSNAQTTDKATTLSANKTYFVTITDSKSCFVKDSATINAPNSIQIILNAKPVSCAAQADGEISATVSGGSGALTYKWNNNNTTLMQRNIVAGKYTFSVTDATNCTVTDTILVTEPLPIRTKFDIAKPSCIGFSNGKIVATVSGGSGGFTYLWRGKGSTTITTRDLDSIAMGTYMLAVTDKNGCTANADVVVENHTPLSINFEQKNIRCFGDSMGAIYAQVAGGFRPYLYKWSNAQKTDALNQLKAGTYTVTVTDQAGCTATQATTLTQPPATISATTTIRNTTCFDVNDGGIQIQAIGGTKPYSYSLNGIKYGESAIFQGLKAGVYDKILVKDASGCATRLDKVTIEQPIAFTVDIGKDTSLNLGDTFKTQAIVQNGKRPIQFSWLPKNNGAGCEGNTQNCATFIFQPIGTTHIGVMVIDSAGCVAKDFIQILVKKSQPVLVPTAFTPNEDGENDQLLVHGKAGIKIKNFRIFDRWGELIFQASDFESNDKNGGWDGTFRQKNMPIGTYAWAIEVMYIDGSVELFKGATTLLR
jgi:gliding motility-associated-like protein